MRILIIILAACLCVHPARVFASDVKRGEKEILLDNDTVQVVRLTYPAGTESGMHTHHAPNRAVYFIKGGTLALVSGDDEKQPKIMTVPDGKTLFFPAMTHNVKNIGKSEVVILEVEIK